MSSANVKPLVHDAIHDLEATFWLLNHLCITLPGPSFSRRNELKVPAGPEDKLLYQKVEELFGDSNFRALALKKRGMFARDSYTDEVVPLFHPYFKPLVPMLTEWWKMLMFSHNVPLIERVHDWVLDIIENALLDPAICHQENPEYAKQEAIMEEERLKQLSALCREGKETLILLSGLPQDAWTWPDDGHNPPDQVPQSPSTQDAGDSPLLVGPGKEDPDHSGTDKEGPNNGRQGKRPRSDSLLLRRLSGSPAPDFQVPGGDAPGPVQKKARHSAGEDKQETSTGIIRKGSS
ncbi:hypothetical protein BDN72DRAFT_189470 [Pluteus cervinus]|uniref:Uncharacterized protein n=1 Tax=Pluteus cervinus TaxID=181527 RepID=A0ACD3AJI9_9AGAR|nr:hypothetical protein BDN72DRAFT_189470 [Pluteus cervinus]